MESLLEYQLIMPIRMITQLEKGLVTGERFADLMDHMEERRSELENWSATEQLVVSPIRDRLRRQDWSRELIQRCVGVTRTNGTRRTATGDKPGHGRAEEAELGTVRMIYPAMAPMSNSCRPNCSTVHNPDYSLTVRTVVPVQAGDELTISYSPLFAGRLERQEDFLRNWFFECTCPRCCDRTDLGSNFDTRLCGSCGSNVLPVDLSRRACWQCGTCSEITEPETIRESETALGQELEHLTGNPVEFYEKFLRENGAKLNKGHCLLMRAECKLLMAYENPTEYVDLKRKCELGEGLLNMLDVIQPGYTDIRGRILYELSAPSFQLLQRNLDSGSISLEQFSCGLKVLEGRVEECVDCLEGEWEGTYGNYIRTKATQVRDKIREMSLFAQYL